MRGSVRRFLGIPYARADRFAAPQPTEAWSGVRDARSFANQCPQRFIGKVKRKRVSGPGFGEDCLNLNVWMPSGGAAGLKPVFVWIHGGAFITGTGNSYDGATLAEEGDICVVTINYRLGVLGWVNLGEALGNPAIPSNLGLRDQIAALEWIRDNIAAFGGDPANVTICGESAGSTSVSMLMLCQRAWSLFHAGILMSGAVSLIHRHETSLAIARRYTKLLELDQGGLDHASLARLQAMDAFDLLSAQAQIDAELAGTVPAAPWYDGDLLPASLEIARGAPVAPVPLMAGATLEEIRLFEVMPGLSLPTSWEALERALLAQLPEDRARAILGAYPRTTKGRRALATDLAFAMPTRHFAHRQAQSQPCWCYRFDYAHPLVGAAHALDLTVFWPGSGVLMALARGGPNSGRRAALGKRMRDHVAHFVRHHRAGDDWPAYRPEERMVRIYNLADTIVTDPEAERFAAWDGEDVALRIVAG